jgi:hypothetical protein
VLPLVWANSTVPEEILQVSAAGDEPGGKMVAQVPLGQSRQRRVAFIQGGLRPGVEALPGGIAGNIFQCRFQGLPTEPLVRSKPSGWPRLLFLSITVNKHLFSS